MDKTISYSKRKKLHNHNYTKLALVFLLTLPLISNALTLGRIKTNSMTGEPLNADIAIKDTYDALKESQIKVKLADKMDFEEVGLSIQQYHKELSFVPYKGKDSKWYIKVKSKKPINSQFMNFLVQVDYPSGHVIREYMVILKSPITEYSEKITQKKAEAPEISNAFQIVTTRDNQKIIRFAGDDKNSGLVNIGKKNELIQKPVLANSLISLKTSKQEMRDIISKSNRLEQEAFVKSNIKNKPQAKNFDTKIKNKIATTLPKTQLKPASLTTPQAKLQAKSQPQINPQVKLQTKPQDKSQVKSQSEIKPLINSQAKLQTQPQTIAQTKLQTKFKSVNTSKPIVVNKAAIKVTTKSGDTLWRIAQQNSMSKVDINRMIYVIYQKNKQAFIGGNINKLMADRRLSLPTAEEISAVTHAQAQQFIMNASNVKTVIASRADSSKNITAKNSVVRAEPKNQSNIKPAQAAQVTKANTVIKKAENKIANKDASSNIIRISTVDGDIRKLQINSPKEVNISTNKATNNKSNQPNQPNQLNDSLIKLSSIQQDLTRKQAAMKANDELKQKLKIIAADEGRKSTAGELLLASEKLIAKQKENQDLKEQILILQAQVKDMQKLVALKKEQELANSKLATAATSAKIAVKQPVIQPVVKNPLLPFDAPAVTEHVKSVAEHKVITTADSKLPVTTGEFVVKSNKSQPTIETRVEANSSVSSFIAGITASLTNVIKHAKRFKVSSFTFWLWAISLLGGATLIYTYTYWRRNYRYQPATPDIMSEHEPIVVEGEQYIIIDPLADIEEYIEESKITKVTNNTNNIKRANGKHSSKQETLLDTEVEEVVVTSARDSKVVDSEIEADFDLVRAYMELNDYATARKILNDIITTGNKGHKEEAHKILESIPA